MEVEQVLAHDEHAGAQGAAIVLNAAHEADGPGKTSLHPGDATLLQPVHGQPEALVEGGLGAAGHQLVGAHLAQQLLQRVDHGQPVGDAHGGEQVHLEAGVHVVGVGVVVGDDGDLGVAGVVEGLAQQGRVVGEAAVADVLAHGDSGVVRVVGPALQGGERLADDHLAGEADVVVHVLLAQAYGVCAAHRQAHGPEALPAKRRGHQHREGVRGVGHEHGLFLGPACAHARRDLGVVRVAQGLGLALPLFAPAGVDGFDEAAHAYAQRAGDVALIDLEHQGHLACGLAHEAGDLV